MYSFNSRVIYKNFTGLVIAKQLQLPGTMVENQYLVAFGKPTRRGLSEEEYQALIIKYRETFGDKAVGPVANVMVPEGDLTMCEVQEERVIYRKTKRISKH